MEVNGHGGVVKTWRPHRQARSRLPVVVGLVTVSTNLAQPLAWLAFSWGCVHSQVSVRPAGGASDTHPGLLEAVGPTPVVGVFGDVLRLLELLPQPLYPVVVARC